MTLTRPTPEQLRLPVLLGAVTAVLVAALALVTAQSVNPTYRSTAVLSIDQPLAVAASADGGVLAKLSRLRFTYVGLVGTDRIAVPVAQRLRVPVEDVRGRLVAQAQLDDLLLRVSGLSDSPAQARRTAEALAAVLPQFVAAEQQAARIPAQGRVELTLVQPALGAEKIAPRRARTLALATALGLLAGAAVGAGLLVMRRPSRAF